MAFYLCVVDIYFNTVSVVGGGFWSVCVLFVCRLSNLLVKAVSDFKIRPCLEFSLQTKV